MRYVRNNVLERFSKLITVFDNKCENDHFNGNDDENDQKTYEYHDFLLKFYPFWGLIFVEQKNQQQIWAGFNPPSIWAKKYSFHQTKNCFSPVPLANR